MEEEESFYHPKKRNKRRTREREKYRLGEGKTVSVKKSVTDELIINYQGS